MAKTTEDFLGPEFQDGATTALAQRTPRGAEKAKEGGSKKTFKTQGKHHLRACYTMPKSWGKTWTMPRGGSGISHLPTQEKLEQSAGDTACNGEPVSSAELLPSLPTDPEDDEKEQLT